MRHLLSASALFLATFCFGQEYDDYIGAGHDSGISVSSSSESNETDDINTINGFGLEYHLEDASRFLGQATLGADWETIEEVAQLGIENWIDVQYALPETSLKDTTEMIWEHFLDAFNDQWGEDVIFENNMVLRHSLYMRMAWWNNIMKGEDLLRHRVALALSELLVISEKSDLSIDGPGMSHYYDVLYHHAFGNYRDLLVDVTYHPCMGYYLSHLNNEKTDEENNIHPDENYAREVMQLFAIGLFELNQDGTLILDDDDLPVATYDNNDIKEYAKVFTGLGPAHYYSIWEDLSSLPIIWDQPFNTIPSITTDEPMLMYEEWHEPGQKFLLNDFVVPDGQTGDEDIQVAIESLFQHPNIAPFICKQLIQRLVKSNPTPGYVQRVADVFDDNGEEVRGDMKAVVKAILLDEEARDCAWIDEIDSGKLREPLVRYTQMMRAFNAANESMDLWNVGFTFEAITQQHIMSSPSVFNFFLPAYTPAGPIEEAGLVGPEFQILNAATSINWINLLSTALFADYYMEVSTQASSIDIGVPEANPLLLDEEDLVNLDLSDEIALADDPVELINRLDILLCGGTMTEESKETITDIVALFALDENFAAKTALFMTLISPDYAIQK